MKSTAGYWNPLAPKHEARWEVIDGFDGNLTQLTIAEDPVTGDYTRLTRFRDGYSAESFGARSHDYPEEIFVVSGRLYDEAFGIWLEPGHYASRPPGELHGPFKADGDVVVLEISYPSQSSIHAPEALEDSEGVSLRSPGANRPRINTFFGGTDSETG